MLLYIYEFLQYTFIVASVTGEADPNEEQFKEFQRRQVNKLAYVRERYVKC